MHGVRGVRRARFANLIHFAYTSYTGCGIRLHDGESSTDLPVTCLVCLAEVGKYNPDAVAQMFSALQRMVGVLANIQYEVVELQRTTKENLLKLEHLIQKTRADYGEDP